VGLYDERVKRLISELDKKGIEVTIIANPLNTFYFTGFPKPFFPDKDRATFLLLNVKKEKVIIFVPELELYEAEDEVRLKTIEHEVRGVKVKEDFIKALTSTLKEMGLRPYMRIGVEGAYVGFSFVERLENNLGWKLAKLQDVSDLINDMRAIKDEHEVRLIRRACDVAIKAINNAIEHVEDGIKESELASIIVKSIVEEGATLAFEPIVASGSRAAYPHGAYSDKKVRRGEPIVMDVGARVKGYCADVTRTVVIGKPNGDLLKAMESVRNAQERGIEALRGERTAEEVDQEVRKVLEMEGYGMFFIHSTGHGVGIEVHEKPRIGVGSKDIIKRGMVVTIEPGIYIKGKYGIRIEDTVVVREKAEVLSIELEKIIMTKS